MHYNKSGKYKITRALYEKLLVDHTNQLNFLLITSVMFFVKNFGSHYHYLILCQEMFWKDI